jgi:predicted PurR-regulated permease PerM
LLAVGTIVFLLVAWVGRVIVMLLLAAVVFAVLLSAVVAWVTTKLKIRRGVAFALLLAAGFVVMFFSLWIRGPRIIE